MLVRNFCGKVTVYRSGMFLILYLYCMSYFYFGILHENMKNSLISEFIQIELLELMGTDYRVYRIKIHKVHRWEYIIYFLSN